MRQYRLVLLVLLVIGLGPVLAACETRPTESPTSAAGLTKGPIPESAWRADGTIDESQVPDFIPATDDESVAGWIASDDVMSADRPEIITVYGGDLVTVVGHMYPGEGFVPIGNEPASARFAGQDRVLTILVRNESNRPAVLEITEPPDEVQGRARLIAPSVVVQPSGEQEVVLTAPRDRWSLRLANGDGGFLYSDELGRRSRALAAGALSALAIVIDANGHLSLESER